MFKTYPRDRKEAKREKAKKNFAHEKLSNFFFPESVYSVSLFPKRRAYQIVSYGFITCVGGEGRPVSKKSDFFFIGP
jgi:hypothetical protein